MTDRQTPLSRLDFICTLRLSDVPATAQHAALRGLVDTLGVAASQTELSRIIHAHAAHQFGGDHATLWQDGRRVSAAGAALANAMTIDALDAHDGMKLTKGHVGCGVVAGLVALMQAEGVTDPEVFMTCLVIGYEIGTRAGIALHASACDYHTSGAWIALAVAAVGARVMGLSRGQTAEALGIAEYHGPRSQMMRCIDAPTMVKDGSGWGAMAGVSAAYLARDGFTGAPALTMENPALAEIWGDLDTCWRVEEQYIKLYPVCRWAQPAVEGALAVLRAHGVSGEDVERVRVETFHEATRLSAIPTTTEQAQYSLPFSVAAAIRRGTIGVAEVTEDGLTDAGILELARRVEMAEDHAFNAAFPARRYARVTLTLADGRSLSSAATEAQGDPENPVSDTVIWDKFRRLSRPVMGADWAERVLRTARTLPDAESIAPLFDLLAEAPPRSPG